MHATGKSLRNAFIYLCVFLLAPLQLAEAASGTSSYEAMRRQENEIAVTLLVSGLAGTGARFAEDIRNVVNDMQPGGVRVLPVLGNGGLQNLNDVLFLKSIDMGIVGEDNLRLLEKKNPRLYAGIAQRIQYITKLYNSEFHVLARSDIMSFDDLRGKKVDFSLKDSPTEAGAEFIFDALKIDVEQTNYDVFEAIDKLRKGEISAMVILSGAPHAALLRVLKKGDPVHFLALDRESLPNHDLNTIFANYLPAEITHQEYPNLVPEGTAVPTVASRALLVAYAWPEGSARYNKIANFVDAFFSKIDQFHSAARHPKWKEVNLAAEMPGWTRFKPAADWLAAHQNTAESETRRAFERFIQNYSASTGQKSLSASDREQLYSRFMRYFEAQKMGQTAR